MAHLNLVMIHPYREGNGRMARALQTMVLAQDDLLEPAFSSVEERLGRNTDDHHQVDPGPAPGRQAVGRPPHERRDRPFETERYRSWCAENLPHLDEQVSDRVTSPAFDRRLLDTVRATYPPHEHARFLAHFRGLLDLWVHGQHRVPAAP